MPELHKSPKFWEFMEKVRALAIEYKEHIGPQPVWWEDQEYVPEGELFLDRVIVITTWLDAESDEWLTRACDMMPLSQILGIFHRQLYED